MSMQGICKVCGCVCVLDEMWVCHGCPACRAARVAEAFRPIDPLRTALGMPASFTVTKTGEIDALGREYWRGERFAQEDEQTDVPSGCKMPNSADDQVYQLARLFRL